MATQTVTQTEALERARSSNSTANFSAIYAGFTAKGIPFGDITPRVNVLTFNAWKALGRRRAQGRARRSHHDLGRNDQDRRRLGRAARDVPPAEDHDRVPCFANRRGASMSVNRKQGADRCAL